MGQGGMQTIRSDMMPEDRAFQRRLRGQGLQAARTALGGPMASAFNPPVPTGAGGGPTGDPTGGGTVPGAGGDPIRYEPINQGPGTNPSGSRVGGFSLAPGAGGSGTRDRTTRIRPDPSLGGGGGGAAGGAAASPESFFTGPHQQTPREMAQPFMNPFLEDVVGATQADFDRQREMAVRGANQRATQAGAFGGSRAAVERGARLGEIDRAEADQLAKLRTSGFESAMSRGLPFAEQQRQLREQQLQEPLFRQRQALGFLGAGMGDFGNMRQIPTNRGAGVAGGALSGASIGSAFGPWGAAAGGVGGGLLGML